MNFLLRTCKCHWAGGENLHWGRAADRRPFAEPGTPPRFPPDAPVTSGHMRLELHLDFAAERVWGTTTHECEVRAAEAVRVVFNAVSLEIGAVRVNGEPAVYENDGAKVVVRLPRPHGRGETFTVALEHGVTQPAAGLYFTRPDPAYPDRFPTVWSQGQDEDSRYYFPCLDAPNFKQTSEALLYVPRGWFALSNGDLVTHQPQAAQDEDLWHYRLELPYSTYLFSVVAGEFAEHREHSNGVEVRWYVQRGREPEGHNAFARTADILRYFSGFTGVPYPYGQYTQIAVPDFVFGGMENFTVTTQTDLTLHDDRAHLDFSSDDLVAHEAAHSWFGNLVTARGWAHAWLHESFATYLEALYLKVSQGGDEFDHQMLRDAESYFHEDRLYRRPLVTHRYEAPIDLFDAHLYPGGAVRLRHLHALLGDAPFRGAIKRYLEAHRLGVAETVDLSRAIEAETGLNYDWWFHQWIHSGGYPALEIAYEWKDEDGLAVVTIKQTQPVQEPDDRGVNARPDTHGQRYFRLPTVLLFRVGNAEERIPITVEGQEARFVFRLPRKPKMVLFDPDFTCPVKAVTFDKSENLLIYQLEHAPRPVARIEAASALAEKPSQRVVSALARALKREPFWGVQQRIARALARIGGQTARDALIAALKLPHPKARREVIAQLGYFKEDDRVAAALTRKAAQGDASYYVEGELARALGRSRVKNASKLLEPFLSRPSHAEVIRSGVYDGLAELGDAAVLPLIRQGARYGAPAMARVAAVRAAGELGRRYMHLRPEVRDLLAQVAEDRGGAAVTFRTKLAAIRALERMGDLDALPILRRVAENEVDGRIVRLARVAARTLRENADKPAELTSLRTDLDQVLKENKALRQRMETLEQTSRKPGKRRDRSPVPPGRGSRGTR